MERNRPSKLSMQADGSIELRMAEIFNPPKKQVALVGWDEEYQGGGCGLSMGKPFQPVVIALLISMNT